MHRSKFHNILIGLISLGFYFLSLHIVRADSSMWDPQQSLPVSKASFVAYLTGSQLIVLGGATTVVDPHRYDSIIGVNGQLGSWSNLSFDSRYWQSLAESANNIYVLGGTNYPPEAYFGNVKMTPKDPSNNSWTDLTSLPVGRGLGGAIIINNRLYFAGGRDATNAYKQIFMAPINADGTIGSWSQTSDLPTNLEAFGIFTQNNKMIIVGGNITRDNIATSAVWSAPVDVNGNIGSWVSENSLPISVARFSTARVGDTIIIIGGTTNGALKDSIYYANLAADGTVGAWQTSTSTLPKGTCCGAVASTANYLYSIGGYDNVVGYTSDVNKAAITDVIALPSLTPTPTPTNTPSPTPTNTPIPTPTFTPTPTPDLQTHLPVPLLKQTNPLWASIIYDHATGWAANNSTIARWGCGITDAVMVLRYYGYLKLPDGTALDPKSLNSWLLSQKDGYVNGGEINWLVVSRISKLAKSINNISFDALEYFFDPYSSTTLKNLLADEARPAILDVVGHFVVAKGISGLSDFEINDPYYSYTLASSYPVIQRIGSFKKSNTDLSYVMLTYPTGVTIEVRDSANQLVGQSFEQSPLMGAPDKTPAGSAFNIYYVQKPTSGDYKISITSNSPQTFDLKVFTYDQDGNVSVEPQREIVGPNSITQVSMQFHKDNSKKNKSNRVVTFDTLLGDIKTEVALGNINILTKNTLLDLSQGAKDSYPGNKRLTKKILQTLENIIHIEPKFLINKLAEKLLTEDIETLLHQL